MPLIDSHAHLTSDELYDDIDTLLERAHTSGVEQIVNICTDVVTLERGLILAKRYPWIFNTASTTPHDVATEGEIFFPLVEKQAKQGALIAIGETGLDYFHNHSPKELQQEFLRRYLKLALTYHLPVVIHCRDAFADFFTILDKEYTSHPNNRKGVLHCFTGTVDEALSVVERGWLVSFSGIISFKKSEPLRDVVRQIPLEHILIETDAPYLAPQSKRGKRNEPAYLTETAEVVAQCKGVDLSMITTTIANNFKKIFLSLVVLLFIGSLEAVLPSKEGNSSIKDPVVTVQNELHRLDTLIQATEKSLEEQKRLKNLIVEYEQLQEEFIKNPNDNELLIKVIKSAYKTLNTIRDNHLAHTFDPDFIDELSVLAQPAMKRSIPKP